MEAVVLSVIRPQRQRYSPQQDLGPALFHLGEVACRRRDVEVVNARGCILQCSFYEPLLESDKPPCVVYCHGNCGSRLDAFDIVEAVLPIGIAVFSFDFSGSGLSEGQFVSLGFYEKDDLAAVVDYLRTVEFVSSIAVWGRSMGAATAILYTAGDREIAGLVLDSPFCSLSEVTKDIIQSYKYLPSTFSASILKSLKRRIRQLAGFDMDAVSPISAISKCRVPVMFIHSVQDAVVSVTHSVRLFEQCPHLLKSLVRISGGHDSRRSKWVSEDAASFVVSCFRRGARTVLGAKKDEFRHQMTGLRKLKAKGTFHASLPVSPANSSPCAVSKSVLERTAGDRTRPFALPEL